MSAELQDALKTLLDRLNAVSENHGEIFDTDVREQMFDAVYLSVLKPRPGYTLPERFGMYEPEGNQAVREALEAYAQQVLPLFEQLQFTPQQRLEAFQDAGATTPDGLTPDEFFGYLETI